MLEQPEDSFENRLDLSEVAETAQAVRNEVQKVIMGQHQLTDLILTAILANGHVLIEGVPGVAKTLAAKVFAKVFSADFSRIQFTPDLMPSDVLGTSVFDPKTADFVFRAGPIFSNIILIDEINRAPAKTQAALFEVMEERQVTLDGHTYSMTQPFMVMATQNPIEQEGTYRLPEAQLDRFMFKIEVDYPTEEVEIRVLRNIHEQKGVNDLNVIQAVLSTEKIARIRDMVQQITVEHAVLAYIAAIVGKTRKNPLLFLGASPRASINILLTAKATAAMAGRDFVTPDDVKQVALPVLVHRVVLSPEQEMEGIKLSQVIAQLIEQVEVPR